MVTTMMSEVWREAGSRRSLAGAVFPGFQGKCSSVSNDFLDEGKIKAAVRRPETDTLKLSEVILGEKCAKTIDEVSTLVRTKYENVAVYRARQALLHAAKLDPPAVANASAITEAKLAT
jgi:hypothetical protein